MVRLEYDSVEAFMSAVGQYKGYSIDWCGHWNKRDNSNSSWFGGQTHEQIVEHTLHGDDSLVAKAEKMLEQLDTAIEVQHSEWVPSVYGAYPMVPEFIAGNPLSMRHKVMVPSDSTPIGIWIDLTSSASVDADTILRKGVVAMALLLKLQQYRAVTLHCLCAFPGDPNGGTLVDVTMPTAPLNVGQICHWVTCVGVCRDLMYGLMKAKNNSNLGTLVRNESELREFAAIPENDVVIPSSHLEEYTELQNAIKWIQDKINKYVEKVEEY